jgi:hypothetical protein
MSEVTIKETRRLVLPLQTVVDAVLQFDSRWMGVLSRGDVVQAEFVQGGQHAGLNVAVQLPNEGIIEWSHFSIEEISGAIISYCRAKKIPLPYSGVKSLVITTEGAAFSIDNTVNLQQVAPPRADLSGRPLRYAKGYEPLSIVPTVSNETYV